MARKGKIVPINLNEPEDINLHDTIKEYAKRTGRSVTSLTLLLWQACLDEQLEV